MASMGKQIDFFRRTNDFLNRWKIRFVIIFVYKYEWSLIFFRAVKPERGFMAASFPRSCCF